MSEEVVRFEGVTKAFVGVTALDSVTLSLVRGECHGLMGENGAGKSTLGKVLAGIYRPDAGRLIVHGTERNFRSPADALRAGVGMVHQELAFCPDLTVAENLCMGAYPRHLGLFVDRREMARRATELLERIGVTHMNVNRPMRELTTAQEQLVQIASAVGTGAQIMVFDEPTSSLSEPEARRLFTLIDELKARHVTIVYVSHRMPEVFRLCDRISVLRDGRYVGTLDRAEATQNAVVQMMIGRSVEEYFPQHLTDGKANPDRLLEVRNLSSPGKFENITFTVRAGEVVGFAGLVGSGRSEVANAVFGLDSHARGEVVVNGFPLLLRSVKHAKRSGLGLLPEDRKRQGLVLSMSCEQNFSLAMLDRLRTFGMLKRRRERVLAREYFDRLRVKTPSLDTTVGTLSGGNQQKVALAKWLGRNSRVLIVDEPTRGVDVGAKAAIHELIDELARQNVGVVLISSELPEVINLSTRILVMREGRIVAEVPRDQATQESVMRLMAGVDGKATAAA